MRGIALLALVLAFGPVNAAERVGACGQALLADVALVLPPQGGVYVPVSLGEQEVYFSLSMASGLPLIGSTAAHALGLAPLAMTGRGEWRNGEQRITQYVKLEGLRIGNYRLLSRAAPMIPQSGEDAPQLDGRIVAGVLGSDVFRNVDAELLLAERRLRLYRPVKCLKGSLVDWAGEESKAQLRFDPAGTLVFNLDLNGKRVESTLLSGEARSSIDLAVATRYLGIDPSATDITVDFTGPALKMAAVPLDLHKGPDCKLVGSRPGHGGIGYNCVNVVPFHLGTELLERLRVYVSVERGQILLAPLP